MSFSDINNGTVVGDGGVILRTTDGGALWVLQNSGTVNNLNGVSFSDSLNGTIVGANGVILRTNNAGATWAMQTSSMQRDFYGVSFADINTGYAVGDWAAIYKTTDGGSNWVLQNSGVVFAIYAVSCIDTAFATAVGMCGSILRNNEIPVGLSEIQSNQGQKDYILGQCHPNPAITMTTIDFSLRNTGNIQLFLSDFQGRKIKTLMDQEKKAGTYSIDVNLSYLCPGLYYISLITSSGSIGQTLIIVR